MQDELDSRARREETVKTLTDLTRVPEVVKISGEEVWTTEQGNGLIAYVWFHGDTTGWFMSPEPEAAEAFLTAYLAEANG